MNLCCCAGQRGSLCIGIICLLHATFNVVYCSLVLAQVVTWGSETISTERSGPLAVNRIALSMGVVDLIASCILLAAACYGWRHMLLVWTTVKSSCLTVAVLFFILGLTAGMGVGTTVGIALDFLVQVVFILVVLRHYQDLRDRHYLRKLSRHHHLAEP